MEVGKPKIRNPDVDIFGYAFDVVKPFNYFVLHSTDILSSESSSPRLGLWETRLP